MNHKRAIALAAVVTVCLAVIAALGAGGAGARRAAKAPITVMTIASIQTQVGTGYPQIFEAARVYAAWANAHGGLNGHQLRVVDCDDRGDPNQAETCARQAVSSKVAAVVGSFSANDARIIPVLQQANIAYFGTCCGFSQPDFTAPNSFPLGSQWALDVGLGAAAGKFCGNIGVVNFDVAGFTPFLDSLYTGAIKGYSKSIKSESYVPLTPTDLSPQVAQVTGGTDCLLLGITEAQILEFMAPFNQGGTHQRLLGLQGNLDTKTCAPYWKLCNNAVIVSAFPDINDPSLTTYRAALKQYKAKAGNDYNSLAGIGTWAAYVAFADVVGKMSGTVDGPGFLAAASHATVSTGGITPRINFTNPWSVPGFPRMFNRTVRYEVVKNKQFVPLDNKFHDMSPAFLGKKAGF